MLRYLLPVVLSGLVLFGAAGLSVAAPIARPPAPLEEVVVYRHSVLVIPTSTPSYRSSRSRYSSGGGGYSSGK